MQSIARACAVDSSTCKGVSNGSFSREYTNGADLSDVDFGQYWILYRHALIQIIKQMVLALKTDWLIKGDHGTIKYAAADQLELSIQEEFQWNNILNFLIIVWLDLCIHVYFISILLFISFYRLIHD